MHVYDTLIIGCGYAPIGYALANKNVIIIEEHQTCDTAFYMPLSRYNLSLSDLNKKFIDFFDGQNFLSKVTDAKKGEFAYQETAEFIDYVLDLTKQN